MRLNFVLAAVFLAAEAYGQMAATTALVGTVTDKTGAVLANAAVRLVDTKTNQSYETKSNSVGAYHFPSVTPGPALRGPGQRTQPVRVVASLPRPVRLG